VASLGRQTAEALEHATRSASSTATSSRQTCGRPAREHLVTDFGLAQFHAEVGLTRTGDMMGTLRYMSPEQALGIESSSIIEPTSILSASRFTNC